MEIQIDYKVKFFSQKLREKLGNVIKEIILFGSHARGDSHLGSDYDFAVIVKNKDKNIRNLVTDTAVEFLNCYDELAVSLLCDQHEWEEYKRLPIGVNIMKEGISV